MEDKLCWLWLALTSGIGLKKIRCLMERFGTAQGIYEARAKLEEVPVLSEKDRKNLQNADASALREKLALWERRGIRFITKDDTGYPPRLKEIYDAPNWLFVRGGLPEMNRLKIAVVGARSCTPYGRECARYFASGLSGLGVEIVSGLASGIDGYAHEGALQGGGRTFAVLGCGIDICYPEENYLLYERLQERGGILSEYPPGTKPAPGLFPLRNRIISGMTDGVLVVEAREKSGSLITADQALEQGREVFAIPGRITDPLSVGCNRLLKSGAKPVSSLDDIMEEYEAFYSNSAEKEEKRKLVLETPEKIVYASLRLEPKHINQIMEECGLEIQTLLRALFSLQGKGLAAQTSMNQYTRSGLDLPGTQSH